MKSSVGSYLIIKYFWLAEIIFLLILYYQLPHNFDKRILQALLIGVITNIFIFVKICRREGKPLKHIPLIAYLFLFSYCIVFFQKYVDLSLGIINENDKVFGFSQSIIHCCVISFVGILGYFFGYVLKGRVENKINETRLIVRTDVFNVLIVFSTVLYIFYNVQNVNIERSQELLEAQSGSMVLYSRILYTIISDLYIVYKVHQIKDMRTSISFKMYMKEVGFVYNICLLLIIVITILSGGRSGVVAKLLFYFGGYLLCRKKSIPKIVLAIILLFSVILMSSLGQSRKVDRQQSFSNRLLAGHELAGNIESISPFTNELAGSVETLQYSEHHVPSNHPYVYGMFQLKQVFSSIPFFNHVVYMFTDNSPRYISSAFFVTWLIQGDYYTYGSGSSCNADLYLSFGIWGVLIGLFLWGMVIRRAEHIWTNKTNSTTQTIVVLTLFSEAVFVCRDSLLCFLNVMVFTLIADYFFKKLIVVRKQ